MELPPELLDDIISYIPPDDYQSLQNCSLVAKPWVYPSRRRIFKTVNLRRVTRQELWLATISPTNVEVLQHVRSLICRIADAPDSPRPSADPLRDYLPSFDHLERLTFFSGFLPSLTQIGTYSAFQHTLSCISLQYCRATASALVALVDYFPNLTHLDLSKISLWVDDQPALPFSRPLQKLTIADLYSDGGLVLLDQLMGLRPQCDEVSIGMYGTSCPSLAQRVIKGVNASVKRLNLKSDLAGESSVPKKGVVEVSERNAGIPSQG